MTEEKRKYPDPIFKIAGKDSFLEIYDGLDMGQPKMNLKLTTYVKGQTGSAKHVNWYFSPQNFFGFCDAILTGKLDEFIPIQGGPTDNPLFKTFPAVSFGIPKSGDRMRRWILRKTDRGYYGVSILEKERRNDWDPNAPDIANITFNVPPFQLLAMASTAKSYLERKLLQRELQNQPVLPAADDESAPSLDEDATPDQYIGVE